MKTLTLHITNHTAHVTLNRPDVHNAFNEDMMHELKDTFSDLQKRDDIKFVLLDANGNSFCAGGDLNYMKSARDKNRQQNIDESLLMAEMFRCIDELNKPVVAIVQGATMGGGVGLVACCDIVLAHENAFFTLSEVKLGLNPSVISPFVIRKIGISQARRYFVTAEKITTSVAKQIGLVHEVITDATKDEVLHGITKSILQNGPHAMSEVKRLIQTNQTLNGNQLTQFTAEQIADLRAHAEAQEGISAFFEKRKPKYSL